MCALLIKFITRFFHFMVSLIKPLPWDDMNFFLSKMQELDLHGIWFQQDGATCHTACVTMDLLRGQFNENYIHARFNDLTPLNNLCGAMLKLMSMQASPLQLKHWNTTLKHLLVRYRPKYWTEYTKIGLSGWTIWGVVTVYICMK